MEDRIMSLRPAGGERSPVIPEDALCTRAVLNTCSDGLLYDGSSDSSHL